MPFAASYAAQSMLKIATMGINPPYWVGDVLSPAKKASLKYVGCVVVWSGVTVIWLFVACVIELQYCTSA